MATPSSILTRPLSIYSLPPDLLSHLTVRSIQAQSLANEEPVASTSTVTPKAAPAGGALRCQTCPNAAFDTVEEQRTHFRGDWHRYNAKAKLKGKAVSAEEWENMIEGISSISGSASSSSGSESDTPKTDKTDKVARLLQRTTMQQTQTAEIDSDEEAELEDRRRRAHLRTAIIWFSPNTAIPEMGVPKDTQLGVHRALFPTYHKADEYLDGLRKMQLNHVAVTEDHEEDEERRVTLLMVAGGHFAGMVIGIRPRGGKEKQEVKGAGDVRVLKHKTFHRYTTRKKQGGSQALNDNAKSKAVSAGAMLRRYGEQALQEEIRALMTEWQEDLDLSEKIFLRASTHGKKSFWGYEGAVLEKTDERIRVFPFPTRRPTQQELLRCWHELTRVKVSHLSEEALTALDEAYIASLQPKKPVIATPAPIPIPLKPAAPPKDPEEEARKDRQTRLSDMIRKGRLDALRPFWEKYSAEFDSSVLGTAASAGQEEVLRYFLEDLKLDPTISIDGRKAYDLSSTKGVRNVFRRIRHDHPDWWDWNAAHVPVGLSEEAEAAQEAKKVERRKGLRDKMKEREKAKAEESRREEEEEKRVEAVKQTVPNGLGRTGPQKLGGAGAEGALGGLSAEMRMKIEREMRARAAESRLR